jgi:ferritin-like metal-binding protein YciE
MEKLMPSLKSPEDILATGLKEIYSAERQLSRSIPRFAKKASSSRLREMLDQRRERGAALIEQLDDAFSEMHVSKGRQKNIAAEGLLEDVNEHLGEIENKRLFDPVLLSSVQKIEHYCIAAWGTAASVGRLLGEEKVAETMKRAVEEGKRFDADMTKLADEEVNPEMLAGDEDEEDDEKEKSEGDEEEAMAKGEEEGSSRRKSARKVGK